MKKCAFVLIPFFTGCTSAGYSSYEMYSEKPLDIQCAKAQLESSELVKEVWLNKYSIKFKGMGFEGELYHGTEGASFIDYGLTISKGTLVSKSTNELVNELTDPIYQNCNV